MDIYVSVSDKDRRLIVDGDLDLLDRLLATVKVERNTGTQGQAESTPTSSPAAQVQAVSHVDTR